MSKANNPAAVQELPVFTTSNVMYLLWQKARPSLTEEEKQWFARHAQGEVAHQLMELEAWMASIGVALCAGRGTDSYWEQEDLGRMLGTVSTHMGTLSALSFIGEVSMSKHAVAPQRPAQGGANE